MKRLIDVIANPSGFDSMPNYAGEIPDTKYLVLLTRSRDSDVLTESNWKTALKVLGGESETVEIFRFGHWACGWWEALCVVENTPSHKHAITLHKRIEAYPILDENDFSERETEEANRVWKDCYDAKDRIKYIREHDNQFEFQSFSDLRAQVRGEYFGGYASELLN